MTVAFYLVVMEWRIGKIRPSFGSTTYTDRRYRQISVLFFAMFSVFGIGLFSTANDLELQLPESVILASHQHKPTIGSSTSLLVISKRGQNTIALYFLYQGILSQHS